MNADTTKVIPYGLFRYLYNSYQVRHPNYYMFVEPMLPRDAMEAVGEIEAKDLDAHLPTNSWLIGLERPDLAEPVQALWGKLSPLTRGNGFYPALSYAIKNKLSGAVEALLEHDADPRGLEPLQKRSPLALAFQQDDFQLIQRLLKAGASLEDGHRYEEAPFFYGKDRPVEWVQEHLSDLLGLLPIEAKPIFHSPHAMGGHYYTLLECVWDDPEKLAFAEQIGMELRLTEYEMARLIRSKQYAAFSNLVGRLDEFLKEEALARVQREWPGWGTETLE